MHASQSSSIVKFLLLVCAFLLLFLLRAFPILDQTSGHKWSGLVVA